MRSVRKPLTVPSSVPPTAPGPAARAAATLRERKKVRTRDALAAAALELARTRGFEATTIEDVAAAADVSRRTFFRYFATKEAALFPHHARRLARFRDVLDGALAAGAAPFAAVRASFLVLAGDYLREREEIVAQQRTVDASPALIAFERTLDREWEDAVALGLAGGPAADRSATPRDRILAGAAMGAIRATLRQWFDSGGRLDLARLGRETFDLLERGFEPGAAPERGGRGGN